MSVSCDVKSTVFIERVPSNKTTNFLDAEPEGIISPLILYICTNAGDTPLLETVSRVLGRTCLAVEGEGLSSAIFMAFHLELITTNYENIYYSLPHQKTTGLSPALIPQKNFSPAPASVAQQTAHVPRLAHEPENLP